MGLVVLFQLQLRGSEEQRTALVAAAKRLQLSDRDVAWRISRACETAAHREMSRMMAETGVVSQPQGCTACRLMRAEECSECPLLGPSFQGS